MSATTTVAAWEALIGLLRRQGERLEDGDVAGFVEIQQDVDRMLTVGMPDCSDDPAARAVALECGGLLDSNAGKLAVLRDAAREQLAREKAANQFRDGGPPQRPAFSVDA